MATLKRTRKTVRGGARIGAGRPPSVDGYGRLRMIRLPSDVDRRVVTESKSPDPLGIGDAIARLLGSKRGSP